MEKVYTALLERTPKTATGRIDVPIGRDPANRRKRAVAREGRPAVSEFTVVERFEDGKALVHVKLLTGRTHQIRVHMAFIGCPIVGDAMYGSASRACGGSSCTRHTVLRPPAHRRTDVLRFSPLPERLEAELTRARKAR